MCPWKTGDVTAPTEFVYRRVRIPNDLTLIMAVNGALLDLIRVWNWEKFGTETPEQAAALMDVMYSDYLESSVYLLGAIFPYLTSTPPVGCLALDGSTYSGTDYPDLFAILDPAFKSGGNFTLPDIRGRTIIGAGMGTGLTLRAVGAAGGEETHVLTVLEMPTHSHSEGTAAPTVINGGLEAPAPSATPSIGVTGNAGGDTAHNNMQPFTALNYCVVAR